MKNFLIGENKCMTEGVTKETFETQSSASDDKINKEISDRKQEIGELSTLSTDEKSNIVSAINEVFEKSRLSLDVTYYVDSDQTLLNWANNVEGNDYSAVFIKKGEWTSTVGVNLTTAGTKAVQGEAGSKLVFNEVEKGLFYDAVPTTSDYWMRDVTVECTGTVDGYGYGFYDCTNLTNCKGTVTGTGNGYGFGFYDCTNLTNCTGTGNGTVDGRGYGFSSCTNLTNCTGNGTGTGTGYGFRECTNLTNCTGNGTGTGTVDGFGYGYGFQYCRNLTNCTGTGTGTGTNTGYGFHGCKGVFYCKEGDTPCTTSLFNESYSSLVEDDRFLCNGTADGGFNGEDVSSYGSVGNIQDLTTTDKSSVVAAINEINNKASSGGGSSGGGSSSDGIVPTFTYEVNSDQALLDWANNKSGNDYSAVLIRRGTWTSTVGVNLTTSGTKVVVGEAGSKLTFNEVEKGLFYSESDAPTTPDYWMRDVTVECNSLGTVTSNTVGFRECTNLTNCTSTTNTIDTSNSRVTSRSYGFRKCTNLINCYSTSKSQGTATGGNGAYGNVNGYGFYQCNNLTNCTGSGYGRGTFTSPDGLHVIGSGFYQCTNLTNCTGSGDLLLNSGSGLAYGAGFFGCDNLTNCDGSGWSNSNSEKNTGDGFQYCTNLTNCTGTGRATSYGYGFNDCKRVSGCKKGSTCTTSVFNASYASFSTTSTYTCADTPEGGFNDPTN